MSNAATLRLVQCGQHGEPLQDLGRLPQPLQDNCQATAKLFASIGFHPPWVGYVSVCGDQAVGGCAFVGAPKGGLTEIAYFTLAEYEGRGFATQTVSRMVEIARQTDPRICLTAKTLPNENPSTAILRRTGFQFVGETSDDDIGLAWAWRLPTPSTSPSLHFGHGVRATLFGVNSPKATSVS